MRVSELALLKLMHQRIAPNTPSMEHYARAFSALILLEKANVHDLCRLTGLDDKSIKYLLGNLLQANIILRCNNEFAINLQPHKLLELIEKTQKKEFKWIIKRKTRTNKKNYQTLACTNRAQF